MLPPLPRCSGWAYSSLLHPSVSAFPATPGGSACTLVVSRLARRSLTLRPAHAHGHQVVTALARGFRHFVSSMPAPVASGWSVRRVGLSPTGKRRLPRRTGSATTYTEQIYDGLGKLLKDQFLGPRQTMIATPFPSTGMTSQASSGDAFEKVTSFPNTHGSEFG